MLNEWDVNNLNSNSSKESNELLKKVLAFNHEDRYNALQCLSHNWISNNNDL